MLGVFDSGLGGLAVAGAIRRLDTRVDLVVFADQARAPYGDRPHAEVLAFAHEATDLLAGRGCSTIVVACNTASTVALAELRLARPNLFFVGMEPAVKPAVAATRSGVVVVVGTTTTIEGRLLADVVARFGGSTRVVGIALPGLVELVEDGLADAAAVDTLLSRHLDRTPVADADVLVLACTHYGFARPAFERVLGPGVTIIDPAEAVARQALRHTTPGDGRTTLITSGDPVRARRQVALMLGWDLPVERHQAVAARDDDLGLNAPARP
jgi:glutamate racemase